MSGRCKLVNRTFFSNLLIYVYLTFPMSLSPIAILMVQAPTTPGPPLAVVSPPLLRGVEGAETKLLHRIRGTFGEVMDPVRWECGEESSAVRGCLKDFECREWVDPGDRHEGGRGGVAVDDAAGAQVGDWEELGERGGWFGRLPPTKLEAELTFFKPENWGKSLQLRYLAFYFRIRIIVQGRLFLEADFILYNLSNTARGKCARNMVSTIPYSE